MAQRSNFARLRACCRIPVRNKDDRARYPGRVLPPQGPPRAASRRQRPAPVARRIAARLAAPLDR